MKKANLTRLVVCKLHDFFHLKRACSVVVPNSYALYGVLESDLLAFNKNGYLHEVEVKVTKEDFKRDFLKVTHAKWDKRLGKDNPHRDLYPTSENKHELVKGGYGPNYFWFATPKDLIPVEDIPEYAGLLYLVKRKNYKTGLDYYIIEVAKAAPKIQKAKYSVEIREKALVASMFKFWSLAKSCWVGE